MTIKSIPLSQLVPSPANVRETNATHGIRRTRRQHQSARPFAEFAGAKGGNGKYEVVAGGRRLAALRLLAKPKKVAGDFPVPCVVRDGLITRSSMATRGTIFLRRRCLPHLPSSFGSPASSMPLGLIRRRPLLRTRLTS